MQLECYSANCYTMNCYSLRTVLWDIRTEIALYLVLIIWLLYNISVWWQLLNCSIYSLLYFIWQCTLLSLIAGKKQGGVDVENDAMVRVMKHQPQILYQMLSTVLNIIMFEDCRNQWSMSRPLLPLILLNNEVRMESGNE